VYISASFNALTVAGPIPGTDVNSSTTGALIKPANVSSLTFNYNSISIIIIIIIIIIKQLNLLLICLDDSLLLPLYIIIIYLLFI